MSARHCMAVVISALSMLVVPANIVSAQGGAPLGSWQLDAERSMRTPALPGPPAQSPTIRVFEDWGDGLVFVTNNGVEGRETPPGIASFSGGMPGIIRSLPETSQATSRLPSR